MCMTMEQMREAVMALYPGEGWRRKVAAMPDGQIIAIYHKKVLA